MYNKATPELFMESLDIARSASLGGGKGSGMSDLEIHDLAFYEQSACYLAYDGRSGYAIKQPDDWLCSVFSVVRGRGGDLIESAKLNGAIRLGCFVERDENDKICGHLYNLYKRNGFVIDTNFSDEDNEWATKNGITIGKFCERYALVMILEEKFGETLQAQPSSF